MKTNECANTGRGRERRSGLPARSKMKEGEKCGGTKIHISTSWTKNMMTPSVQDMEENIELPHFPKRSSLEETIESVMKDGGGD